MNSHFSIRHILCFQFSHFTQPNLTNHIYGNLFSTSTTLVLPQHNYRESISLQHNTSLFARWIRVFHHNVEPFCAQCRAEGRMLFNTTHRRYVDVLHVCTAVDFSFVIPWIFKEPPPASTFSTTQHQQQNWSKKQSNQFPNFLPPRLLIPYFGVSWIQLLSSCWHRGSNR